MAGLAGGEGLLLALLLPRGPVTANHALGLLVASLAVGLIGGILVRSRWRIPLTLAILALAFEAGRWGTPGPTVSSFNLASAYGLLAFILGRLAFVLFGLAPIQIGAGLGAVLIDVPAVAPKIGPRRSAGIARRYATLALSVGGLLAVVAGLSWPARTPPIVGPDGQPLPVSISMLEAVRLGGQEQWITIRGHSSTKPVLLTLAGGPGQSDLPYARILWRDLERDFVIVDWDQRGTGKSYPALDPTASLTLEQAVSDTIELSEYLRARFGQPKIYLHGESWGSTLGVLAAQRRPDLYYALIGSGQMVSQRETDRRLYHDVLNLAARTGDQDLTTQMRAFGEPPYPSIFAYALVMQQYDRLYQPTTPPASSLARAPELAREAGPWGILATEYSLIEKINVLRGLMDLFSVLYPQLQDLDFRRDVPRLEVPYYMLDGAAELSARRDLAIAWFDQLDAPLKRRITFADGAHSVGFEQFEAFHQLLVETIVPETLIAPRPPAGPAPERPPLDAVTLAAFFDELVPTQLEERQIPGAVVAAVSEGGLVFARGYGWADLERRSPVVADQTLFHIGSNTKLFTWTALLRLAEQGRVDLDADINTYLDFRIPASYPTPITLRHLLSHTAGFENRDYGMLALRPAEVQPLAAWLPARLPTRVRPPGEAVGYSNYGTALAGYVIERVTNRPYEEYIEQELLVPLGMQHSTVRQAVPPALLPDVAHGYIRAGGGFRDQPLPIYQGFPAGAIRATATDLSRFMLAHLQDGRLGTAQILRADTAQLMHQTLFRPDPRLNGMAYGFWEMDRNGVRVIGHIGSAAPVHYSLLSLLPDEGIGLFVAYNGDAARPLTAENETLAAFLNHFYPSPLAEAAAAPDFGRRASQFTGEYRRNTFGGSLTTIEKVRRVLGDGNRRITDPGDGTLDITGLGGHTRFVEIAPDLFRERTGPELLHFRRDATGRVIEASFSGSPVYTYERVSLLEAPAFNQALVLVSTLLFSSALLASAVRWIVRRWRPTESRLERSCGLAHWVAGVAAGVNLLFSVGLLLLLGAPATLAGDFLWLRALLFLPLLGLVLTAAVVVYTILAWRWRLWGLPERLHYTAVALAMLAFGWFLSTWNLLGFHF